MTIFIGALLLVTFLPVVMYKRRFSRIKQTALIIIWGISVAAVYSYLAIIYFVLMD